MERPELEFDRTTAAENASDPSPQNPAADPQRSVAHAGRTPSTPAQAPSPQVGSGKPRGPGGAESQGRQASQASPPRVGPDPTHLQLASALEKARNQLLDQTHHNRLLSYRELARDLPVLNEKPDQVFEQLVELGRTFYLEPGPETAVVSGETPADPAAESSEEGTADALQEPEASSGPDAAPFPDSGTGSGAASNIEETAVQGEVAYVMEPDGTLTLVSPAKDDGMLPEPLPGAQDVAEPSAVQAPAPEAAAGALAASDAPQTLNLEPPQPDEPRTAGGPSGPDASVPASAPPATPPPAAVTDSPPPTDGGQVLFDLSPKPQSSEQEPVTEGSLQTPLPAEQFAQRLRRLYRAQQRADEETGVNRLHLAFGFLRWRDGGESPLPHLAPLVLVPVHLEKQRRGVSDRLSG